MRKKFLGVIAVLLIGVMMFAFAGCGTTPENFGPVTGGPEASAPVSSNGGLVVKKGDYYFYINGLGVQTDNNDFGKVVKGSLMRAKASELKDSSKHQVIVPKLVYSTSKNGGIRIYGDYIYYTTPSNQKDKTGAIQDADMDICKVKIDGTGTQKLITLKNGHATNLKFIEKSGELKYIAFFNETSIWKMNVDNGNLTESVKDVVGTPIFLENGTIYYSKALYEDKKNKDDNGNYIVLDKKERADADKTTDNIADAEFNRVCKINLLEETDEEIIFNKDLANVTRAKIDFIKTEQDYIYYKNTPAKGYGNTSIAKVERRNLNFASNSLVVVDKGNTRALTADNFITAPNGEGIIYQATSSVNWVNTVNGSDVEKYLLAQSGSTNLAIVKDGVKNVLNFYNDGALKSFELKASFADTPVNFDPVNADAVKSVISNKEAIDSFGTTWLYAENVDGIWFFFNGASDAFNKGDEVKMWKRSGYTFILDGEEFIRIGKLTSADKSEEADKIKVEQERIDKENKNK